MAHQPTENVASGEADLVPAGRLAPWGVDELGPAPVVGLRNWKNLLGPGVLLAGASVGAGEWLFGPAVTAQFGGTVLWLASISIVCQLFLNMEVMRYALYCGEPVFVGFLRTRPGPRFWIGFYLLMEVPNLWPFMASNAAVPLTAAILGHLPGDATTSFIGIVVSESQLVKVLGYVIFLAAFLPLLFGGAVYRMLERVMTIKMVLVLGYLAVVAIFMVSGPNAWEVVTGFFRFGSVPFRASTVIAGSNFSVTKLEGQTVYKLNGTVEEGGPLITSFSVKREAEERVFGMGETLPPDVQEPVQRMMREALARVGPKRFFVEHQEGEAIFKAKGRIAPNGRWHGERFSLVRDGSQIRYDRLEQVPEAFRSRLHNLLENKGLERRNVLGYIWEHGALPPLPWALLAAFFAIAGAGGMSNSLFSNYARDKGWGMGASVGAIPSAVGGRTITLSHVGKVFRLTDQSRERWRGWIRHITRDGIWIWMMASFLGMALPCMLSLEFIRNASVAGDRVAAMTAQAMAERFPDQAGLFWFLTLLCGFLILAPGQVFGADSIARRWTDMIWVVSAKAKKLGGNQVKYVYYGILVLYGAWGLFALSLFDPLQIAKIGAGLANVALGASALHTLHVNRTLLPKELQPGWLRQAGLLACGIIFLGISLIALPLL